VRRTLPLWLDLFIGGLTGKLSVCARFCAADSVGGFCDWVIIARRGQWLLPEERGVFGFILVFLFLLFGLFLMLPDPVDVSVYWHCPSPGRVTFFARDQSKR
jgi:hypothetical protein